MENCRNSFAKEDVQLIAIAIQDRSGAQSTVENILKNEKLREKVNELSFPILADADRKVSKMYGVFNQERDIPSAFLINKFNKLIVWSKIATSEKDRATCSDILNNLP